MNTLLLDALQGTNASRPPIWIMRQAGRYLPEYRALRSRYSFLEMCHTPELIREVTLQPIKAFQMDAAILYSDILMIPEALGVGLRFEESKGPIIERPLKTFSDVSSLQKINVSESLNFVAEGIKLLKKELTVPLIGFCGAPFTVASYMIEGGSSKDLRKTKQWMIRDPESFHRLLDKIADDSIDYLKMQVNAGVQALQIFDSWANFLSHRHFQEFSLRYLKKIKDTLPTHIPLIIFCRGSSVFAEQLATIKPQGISVDWQADLASLRQKIPQPIALQGNLDPDILYAKPEVIRREATYLLESMRGDPAFIFNLGHGMNPDMSPDAVKVLVETVKAFVPKETQKLVSV